MITYKAAYKKKDKIFLGEVLDFPGTISYGKTLEEARRNLADALVDMAETNILKKEPLPLPDPSRRDLEADLEEPIHLLLSAGNRLNISAVEASV